MDLYEVTVLAYWECVDSGHCHVPHKTAIAQDDATAQFLHGGPHHPTGAEPPFHQSPLECGRILTLERSHKPVTCIDHEDAASYCHWRKKRLPTLDEWEYAARGFDERLFPWGNGAPTEEQVTTTLMDADDVGMHPNGRSPFGIFDLGGNVREWTSTSSTYPEHDGAHGGYVVAGDVWFGVGAALELRTFDLYDRHFAFTWYTAPAELTAEGVGFRCISAGEVIDAATN